MVWASIDMKEPLAHFMAMSTKQYANPLKILNYLAYKWRQETAYFLRMRLGSMRKTFNVANIIFSTDLDLWKCSHSQDKLFI